MEIKKLYYSISEVSDITKLKQYVLRYWETEFKQLSPKKNQAGNRKYKKSDIDFILLIKDLLYNQKYTINGARQFLINKSRDRLTVNSNKLSATFLKSIKIELEEIITLIKKFK